MPKQVYGYDRTTKEYTGPQSAPESPREPGVYLIPANSTEIEPPAAGEHQAACFVDGAWEIKADYRDEKYYSTADQSEHEIKELGVEPDAAWTQAKPTDSSAIWQDGAWVVPFAVKQERKKAEILAYYDHVMSQAKQGYSGGEIDTWDIQRKGAADILAGNTSTTEAQFVATLAANRSAASGQTITAVYLAQRIQANVAAAQALNLAALGKQQGQYDLASAATTEAELDAIVCSFDMEA